MEVSKGKGSLELAETSLHLIGFVLFVTHWCFNGIICNKCRCPGDFTRAELCFSTLQARGLTSCYWKVWLQDYSVETALAVIIDGTASLKIDTQHLNVNLRVGSIYQFIGELVIQPDNEGILKARVARNVDGIDLNLYHQSLKLLKEFISDQMSNHAP
ncbi:unnamed protein product [Camellia sinensis]